MALTRESGPLENLDANRIDLKFSSVQSLYLAKVKS